MILSLLTAGVLVKEVDEETRRTGDSPHIKGTGGIFGVLKTLATLRAVWNGKMCNTGFRRPKSVNICDPPRVVHILAEKFGNKKLYCVMGDFRHYFYQIPLAKRVSMYFGVVYRKKRPGKSTETLWHRLTVVPMGWLWAPYVAQCIAWHILTYAAEGLEDFFLPEPEGSSGPPMYRETKGGGLVFLYYDNVHAYFTDVKEAKAYLKRLK